MMISQRPGNPPPEIELTDKQAAEMTFGLKELALAFLDQPGERERFEEWRKEKAAQS